jgi:hypothetical protein
MMGLNRAQRRAADRAGVPQRSQEQQGAMALTEENFVPGLMNVAAHERDAEQPARVILQQFYGPVGPNVYMWVRNARLTPDEAIAIGEILLREGQRVKSRIARIEIPAVGVPADLKAA